MAYPNLTLAFLFTYAFALSAQSPDPLETARRLKAYESALPALRNTGGPTLAAALLEAGQTALASGSYDRASAWGDEAAALFRKAGDVPNEALACNVAGSGQLYRGDYSAALRTFHRALELDRGQQDARGEISRLSNIGSVYFFQGKYLDALDTYEQAFRRVDETASAPWNSGSRHLILVNLAILFEQLGQNQKALDYYQQAAAAGSALTAAEEGQLLSSIGTLYRRLGDAPKALETYQRAQRIVAREHLAGAEIQILQNVGITQAFDFRDYRKAIAAFSEALRLGESTSNRREIVLAHVFRGEAYYRMQRWQEARLDFEEAVGGAKTIGAREEEWSALYGRGRLERQAGEGAQALNTLRAAIGIIESLRAGPGKLTPTTEFLGDKRQVYDAAIELLLRNPERDPRRLFALFEQARTRNLPEALHRSSEPLTLDAVQAKLPAGAMLVEYWTGEAQIAALWITRGGSGVASRSLDGADAALLSGLHERAGTRDWRGVAEQSGGILLAGLPLNQDLSHLMIVPDGLLCSVPFELLIPQPGAPTLIERAAVSYLPSAAMLLWPKASRSPSMPWGRQMIAFGDPLPNPSRDMPADTSWTRLPEAAREMGSIAAAVRGRAAIHAGDRDLKRYLLESGAKPPLLHFSTHAVADTIDPNLSRIQFTPERGQPGSGYLFRGEVQALSLQGVDMVTLSACDTEGGKLPRGEGIQSLSRAFLAAGARSTVTTLWRVGDGPTADFMQLFYQRVSRGDSKAEALRYAKIRFLQSNTDRALPVYWAAFVLNGDGASSVPGVVSWTWVVAVGILLVAIVYVRGRALWQRIPRAKRE